MMKEEKTFRARVPVACASSTGPDSVQCELGQETHRSFEAVEVHVKEEPSLSWSIISNRSFNLEVLDYD